MKKAIIGALLLCSLLVVYGFSSTTRMLMQIGSKRTTGATGWNSGLVTDSNCQAWWKFNDGAILVDAKGNYDLSNAYAAPTNDTADYKEGDACVDFEEDNKQGVYRSGTTNDFNWATTNALTVCAWVKAESSPDAGRIFYKCVSGKACVRIGYNWDSTIFFNTGYNNGDYEQSANHASTLTDGQWYHVSCSVDSSRNYRIRILDSSLNVVGSDLTGTWSNAITFNEDARITIGGEIYDAPTSAFFDGKIDEVVVFDTALSTTDTDKIAAGTY